MRTIIAGALAGATAILCAQVAEATPMLRKQVVQRGDFVLLGNTLAQDCSTKTGAPTFGTVGPCPTGTTGNAGNGPDVFWEADFPSPGLATASTAITAANARSTAVLNLPATATVTAAYLYWGARNSQSGNPANPGNPPDLAVVLDRPGLGGFTSNVNALTSWTGPGPSLSIPGGTNYPGYQAVADITAIVQQNGTGAYRVGGVDSFDVSSVIASNLAVGWWMVVIYQDPTQPTHQIALFDSFDVVSSTQPYNVSLNGFAVPSAAYTAHLAVASWDGDVENTGDSMSFNGNTLSDAQNPANNFFNGTRSFLGVPVSNLGDLPQPTGMPGSMSEMDLDVVDVTPYVAPGQTSATIAATATLDSMWIAGLVTSISTLAPDFSTSTKSVADLTSGTTLAQPGDILSYTINVTNTGDDTSVGTVLTDVLPAGVTYVPGSIQITAGPNAGAKTDAVDADQAEYVAGTNTVTVRLGTGASGSMGGSLTPGQSTVVTFEVKINAGASGVVANQAVVNAAGMAGTQAVNYPTDGNGALPGAPPTTITIGGGGCPIAVCACLTDSDCGGPMSATVCDNGGGGTFTCIPGCRGMNGNGCMTGKVCTSPDTTIGQCVQCTTDSQCGNAMSGKVCDGSTHMCIDGCRGMNGNGCPSGMDCSSTDSTIGMCSTPPGCTQDSDCGNTMSGKVCDTTGTHMCIDGCRGMNGNGCPSGMNCSSTDSTIGMCSTPTGCTQDSDCGDTMSGKVCDTAGTHMCIDGCRGMNGNGCPSGMNCSSTDSTIGMCSTPTACMMDSDCGTTSSGKVCDDTTKTCEDGCRGMNGNGCPMSDVCTSTDSTIGQCVECTKDSDCGGAMSGRVCDDSTRTCKDGCRGMNGNGCPTGDMCTSMDSTIGKCIECKTDSDCGDTTSGKVCDGTTNLCVPGCRATGGNGCPSDALCTSMDSSIGQCVRCNRDSDCGDAASGKVCDATTNQCVPGCRGTNGNGCPSGQECSSPTEIIGMCKPGSPNDGIIASGNGLICAAAKPENENGAPWMLGGMALAMLAVRRRRRR